MIKLLEKIQSMISWYENNARTAGIHQLLDAKDSLVTLNYTLGESFAEYCKNHKIGYGQRKIGIAEVVNRFVKADESHNKAESFAIEEKADIIRNEKLMEGIADSLYIQLKQSNMVVRAMEQRISILRREWEESKKENQT